MSGRNILIVDDDEGIREVLKLTLSLEGYEPFVAANGQEALRILSSMPTPCLILLDLMMPVMDGWAFAEALQLRHEMLAEVPLVVITAFAEKKSSITSRVCGVLDKPIDIERLLEIVRKHCG